MWGESWETYCPVLNRISVIAMLTLIILRGLHIKSVDLFLAYTQDDVKIHLFMKLTICFGVEGSHPREWVIILYLNPYGLREASLGWFEKLKEGLEARDFVNPCVWYKEEMVLIFYVD